MTLLLLNYLKCLSQVNNECSLYGELNAKDTTTVNIPISYIKLANIKLIERNYLIKLNNEKDSIIYFQNNYISTSDSIINDFNNSISTISNINRNLNKSLSKVKEENKYLKIGLGGVIVGVITVIMIK